MDITEKRKFFSIRLRAARLNKGWSQPVLAEKLGVSKGSVGNWESEDSNGAGPENLKKLSELLGVSVAWLTGEGADNEVASGQSHASRMEEAKEIYGIETRHSITTKSKDAGAIIDHFFEFMNRCGDNPERLREVTSDLKKHFPLDRWVDLEAALRRKHEKELGDVFDAARQNMKEKEL